MSIRRLFRSLASAAIAALACHAAEAQIFTPYSPTGQGTPHNITKGADGDMWFTNSCTDEISKVTPDGVVTNYSTGLGGTVCTNAITTAPDGDMWFTLARSDNLGRITTSGAITLYPVSFNAQGVAVGPDGNIWFSDAAGGRIAKMTPGGQTTAYTTGIPADCTAGDLTSAPDGNLWFLCPSSIGRITTKGAVTLFPLPQDIEPQYMVLGPDGNLWFTEQLAGGIARITMAGAITQFPVTTADAESPLMFGPITTGPDGNLWFAGFFDLNFFSITTSGVVTQYQMDPLATGQNPYIAGMAGGPNGTVWFTASGAPGIVKMTLPAPSPLAAAILPGNRTVKAGTPATLFATMINGGGAALTNCQIGLPADAPAGLTLTYQTTDPNTNLPTGQPNQPVTMTPGGSQSFILTLQSSTPLYAPAQPLAFTCTGAAASETQWLNTVGLNFTDPSQPAEADIIVAVASATPGSVAAPLNGTAAFSVAMFNNADASYDNSASISIAVDDGMSGVPVDFTFCQTDPSTGACLAAPRCCSISQPFPAGAIQTFAVFVTSIGPIPFDPAVNRLFVRAQLGVFEPYTSTLPVALGATSIAMRTN